MPVWEGCFVGEKMTFLVSFSFGMVFALEEVYAAYSANLGVQTIASVNLSI